MNTDDIIKMAREAGFTQKNVFSDLIVRHSSGAWVDITDDLTRFAALVTQAERESRQAAQAENEQLKARLARSGVELRKAVRDERGACAIAAVIHSQYPITTDYDKGYDAGRRDAAAAILVRNHIVDANKMPSQPDCTDCDCADNEPCKAAA